MRKLILILLFLLLIPCFNVVADDKKTDKSKPIETNFALGAGFTWADNPKVTGGHFDLGFVLYKNVLYVQNNFMLRGGGIKLMEERDDGSLKGSDHTIYTLSNKIIFGRNAGIPLKLYTYLEFGAGIYGNETEGFFNGRYAYTGGFGGGGEIFGENFGGVYFEVGYIGQKVNSNYPISGIVIQSGWRIFF